MIGVEVAFVQRFMAAGMVGTSRLYTGAGFAKEALDEGVMQTDVFGPQEGEDEAIEFPLGHLGLEVRLQRLPIFVGVAFERHEQSGFGHICVLHREQSGDNVQKKREGREVA